MQLSTEAAIWGVGLLGLGTAALTIRLARRWRRALDQIERAILALEQGRGVRPVDVGPLGRLARALHEVAPRLDERVTKLENDRQRLGAVLAGMAEGVIAVDARHRLLFANPAASRLFGLDAAAVGRFLPELIRNPQVNAAVEATLAGGGPYRGEILIDGPEGWQRGSRLVLEVQGTPLPGSPTPGAVIVFHDLTELRRLERMRQDFVANASHELKTPLTSIKAYTETLLDGALHDEAVNESFLRRIDEQADRLDDLIGDLLSLARLESGQEVFRHTPIPLAPTFRRLVAGHKDRAKARDLEYAWSVEPGAEEAVVKADEEAIRQILDNLIDNAIKYTPSGGSVRPRRPEGPSEVVIEVADTGIGIPREDLPRVFERFYRVDKARSRDLGGTGLGLAIVKQLVTNALGGRIALSSRPGAGSTFTVRLPRHVPTGPAARRFGNPDGTPAGIVPQTPTSGEAPRSPDGVAHPSTHEVGALRFHAILSDLRPTLYTGRSGRGRHNFRENPRMRRRHSRRPRPRMRRWRRADAPSDSPRGLRPARLFRHRLGLPRAVRPPAPAGSSSTVPARSSGSAGRSQEGYSSASRSPTSRGRRQRPGGPKRRLPQLPGQGKTDVVDASRPANKAEAEEARRRSADGAGLLAVRRRLRRHHRRRRTRRTTSVTKSLSVAQLTRRALGAGQQGQDLEGPRPDLARPQGPAL